MSGLDTPPHAHEPNPRPPGLDPSVRVTSPGGQSELLTLAELQGLSSTEIRGCYIVSTGHGTSGPFRFAGPALLTLAAHCQVGEFQWADIRSGDGFFARISRAETTESRSDAAAVLALSIDGRPMTRSQGLARLIVPSERDDALKQVKWVSEIEFHVESPD